MQIPPTGDHPADDGDPVRVALATALGTHFRIVSLLGRGGMGAVYLARESGLDRDVAIKVLPPDKATSEATRERFRREARTAARLTHPNIVPLHAFGEQEGMAYYVMGYVRGESLATRIRRDGALPEEEAAPILVAIAEALQFAHGQGVVHRDVKPDNILLEESSGRPMLTDFGIARVSGSTGTLTGTDSVIGTPDYMSPEQALGQQELDARSDIYSLGVTAYEMLSGRLPFEAPSPAAALARRLTDSPVPLRAAAPQLSSSLEQAVMRCLARDPGARWADAAAFARAIAPRAEEQDELPSAVRWADGFGSVATFVLCLALLAKAITIGVPEPGVAIDLVFRALISISLLLWAILVIGALTHWKAAGGLYEIAYGAFRQPAAWPGWWPRALRRHVSVWDRLPRSVRVLRTAWTLSIAGLVMATAGGAVRVAISLPRQAHSADPLLAASLAPLLALLVLPIVAFVLGRRRGLDQSDAGQFYLGAPLVRLAFWGRPEIAPLLAARPPSRAGSGASTSLVAEIGRFWPASGGPLSATDAGDLARRAAAAIAELGRQQARRQRDVGTAEAEHLAQRLDGLGKRTADEPRDRAQLRELLARQLDLVRTVEREIADARAHRDAIRDALAALRDEVVRGGAAADPQRPALAAAIERLRHAIAQASDNTPTISS